LSPRDGAAQPPRATKPTARAASIIALLRHVETFPELHAGEINVAGLSDRDAKLAHAIVEAALVRWLTIGGLCERSLGRPWAHVDSAPKASLLCGAAQILHLRKVPAFAAVHDTVDAAKQLFGAGVAGFVNAGLRGMLRLLETRDVPGPGGTPHAEPVVLSASQLAERIASSPAAEHETLARRTLLRSDGSAMLLREPLLPADVVQRAAAVSGVPDALARRWAQRHDASTTASLCTHTLCEPALTLNIESVQDGAVRAAYAGGLLLPHDVQGHATIAPQTHAAPEGEEPQPLLIPITKHLSDLPGAFVQDAASGVPVRFARHTLEREELRLGENDLLIDLCAGNGTKTRQLVSAFPAAGSIIATDPDEPRFETLSRLPAELARLASSGAHIVRPGRLSVHPYENVRALGEQASLVLLDVPCSNTGVLARRSEARVRWLSRTQEERLIELQRTILRRGFALLKPGGMLLYATCSLEEEENQAQAAWACKELGLLQLGSEATLPAGQPSDAPTKYRDASFAVLLRKPAR
jgi:transcription termination factor NusB